MDVLRSAVFRYPSLSLSFSLSLCLFVRKFLRERFFEGSIDRASDYV